MKQDPKVSERRRCLFCGGRPLTLEHAWPEWLLRALGVDPKRPAGIMEAQFGPAEEPRIWRGAEIKAKHFCKACNSGWMSALEAQAKPIITPLLADLAVPLDASEQHVLARWSIKTAIVFEVTGPKDWPSLFTTTDREQVADPSSTTLPAGTLVWIGRHTESNVTFAGGRRLLQPVAIEPTRGPSPIEAGYATTFGLGRLVIQVLRVKRREDSTVKKVTLHPKPGPWTRSLIQIWPPPQSAVVQWPPTESFSETPFFSWKASQARLRGRMVEVGEERASHDEVPRRIELEEESSLGSRARNCFAPLGCQKLTSSTPGRDERYENQSLSVMPTKAFMRDMPGNRPRLGTRFPTPSARTRFWHNQSR